MSIAVVNLGDSEVGDCSALAGDALIIEDDEFAWIGGSEAVTPSDHEAVIDAGGGTALPGLIDSHVHVTFGDYTPRQRTVGFLESYLHGGTTTVVSASEVHVPGRPKDPTGVKALAIAAQRCFSEYRPAGVTVHAGSVILEPGLEPDDFIELFDAGVRHAKAGFGAVQTPADYVPLVRAAKAAGLTVMSHTGGGSIPGSASKIDADALLAMRPHVAGHVNGGPTALTPEENRRLVEEGDGIALQIAHAGNLSSAIQIVNQALERDAFGRVLISTDTPTGSGVISLGMLRCMAELSSLSDLTPRQAIAAATGNVADVYEFDSGRLKLGRPADLLIADAPTGSRAKTALDALAIGDLPAIGVAITSGEIRFERSRNTPAPSRPISVKRPGACANR